MEILVVEDEAAIADFLERGLEAEATCSSYPSWRSRTGAAAAAARRPWPAPGCG
jgi:DNA-binding response OmpR family regulator